jgi:hypothetical protein
MTFLGPDHFGAQKVVENKNFEPSMIRRRADLRIIIAPVDSLRPNCAPGMIELCRELVIPHEFLNERIQGVGHSFGTRADGRHGFAAWFRYLCKSIDTESNLLHHRWYKSAFYLKKDQEFAGGGITLVMFGPTPAVTRRIEACITTTAWLDVLSEPFVLFDLVLDALFSETDLTVWRLLDVIHDLEKVSPLSTKHVVSHLTDYHPMISKCWKQLETLKESAIQNKLTFPSCTDGPETSST